MELIALVIGVIVILLIGLFIVSYVKAPPNTAYIISGFRKSEVGKPRVIIGRAAIRIPFLERIDKMSLDLMQVDIKTGSTVPTKEYIDIHVDGVANIKVKSDDESVLKASEHFLGKNLQEISLTAQQVIEGNMREIVGTMELKELVQNRDMFAAKVQESVAKDMGNMGLEVVNLTIQNFADSNEVIKNLGVDNVEKIKKEAAIAKAEAKKEVAIAESKADEEANKARAEAEKNIAEQNKELSLKKSQFKVEEDIKKAEADAAYAIQGEEQRKTKETATVEADIARKEKEIELREREVQVKERELEATIKRKAEAEKYQEQQKADAEKYRREQEAEAKKIEEIKQAEADRVKATVARFKMEEEAEGIRAKGLAEAEAINAKAEALAKMDESGKLEMFLKILPEVVANASKPLENVDKITMYGSGNSAKVVEDVMNATNQVSEGLGLDMRQLISSFMGVKAATNTIIKPDNIEETPSK